MKDELISELPKTAGMKALQILQTVMLTAIIGMGGLLGSIILSDHRLLATIEQTQKDEASERSQLHVQVDKLQDKEEAIDRRVTTIEARTHP